MWIKPIPYLIEINTEFERERIMTFPIEIKNTNEYKTYFDDAALRSEYTWLHKYVCSILYGSADHPLTITSGMGVNASEDGVKYIHIIEQLNEYTLSVLYSSVALYHIAGEQLNLLKQRNLLKLSIADNIYCRFYIISKYIQQVIGTGIKKEVHDSIKQEIANIGKLKNSGDSIIFSLDIPKDRLKMLQFTLEEKLFSYELPENLISDFPNILNKLTAAGVSSDTEKTVN